MPIPIGLFDVVKNIQDWASRTFGGTSSTPNPVQSQINPPARRLGEGFESNAERAMRLGTVGLPPTPGKTGQDPFDLFQQLFQSQLAGLGQGQVPLAQLQAAARQQASVFDPQITALQALMSQAKSSGKSARAEIGDIYTKLADSYKGDIATARKEFATSKEQERAMLAEYQGQLRNNYGSSMDALTEEFQKLGIEAAAPDVMPELAADQGNWADIASRESAADMQALQQMEQGDVQYYTKGAPLARQEGAQVQSELVKQLEAFLTQQRGNLGQIQAQKQNAYMAALSDLQKQQQGVQDDQWNRLLQSGNFMLDYRKQLAAEQKAGTTKVPTKGLKGASQVIGQMLGPQLGAQTYQIFQDMLISPEFRPVTGKLPVQDAAYLATKYGQSKGLNPAQITALMQGVYAYYGRLQ